jgi:hypothetical protein
MDEDCASWDCKQHVVPADGEINDVLGRLQSMGHAEVTVIGALPNVVSSLWAGLSTRTVVITGERREHYLLGRRHYFTSEVELEEFERQLILTVRDPDEIHRNETKPFTVILWRRVSPERHMRVVVALSGSEQLSNSVITAWRPSPRKYRKARESNRLLWEKV